MKLSDFTYDLPEVLIARYPLENRTASRLLVLDPETQMLAHQHFSDLLQLINPEDLLVFNDTKVMPARFFGQKETGGRVEFLIERLLSEHEALAMLKVSKTPKINSVIKLDDNSVIKILARQGEFFHIKIMADKTFLQIMNEIGQIPLPPYMQRPAALSDSDRYQTVYAKNLGAVAAPTAGLHFSESLLQQLRERGISMAQLTLHVGAGTFQPVRVDDIRQHQMHKELVEVNDNVVQAVNACRARKGRVIAVGTTSVRALETASRSSQLQAYQGDSSLFIYPGFEFHCVDALITNFHLPESTLLMLVSAFAGKEFIMRAYQEAVSKQYRFFSYGDAMFINKKLISR